MKQLSLSLLFMLLVIKVNAQLVVDNMSTCMDVTVRLYAHDGTNTACGSYISDPIFVGNSSIENLTLADITWGGSGPDFASAVSDYAVVQNNTGVSGNAAMGCPLEDEAYIGNPIPCSYSLTNCFIVSTVNAGACAPLTQINLSYTA